MFLAEGFGTINQRVENERQEQPRASLRSWRCRREDKYVHVLRDPVLCLIGIAMVRSWLKMDM
jgi:hypothetical protein